MSETWSIIERIERGSDYLRISEAYCPTGGGWPRWQIGVAMAIHGGLVPTANFKSEKDCFWESAGIVSEGLPRQLAQRLGEMLIEVSET